MRSIARATHRPAVAPGPSSASAQCSGRKASGTRRTALPSRRAISLASSPTTAAAQYAANALAVAYAGIGEGEKSRGLYDEAEALFRRLGERSGLGRVLNNRGYGLLVEGDLPAAERALREAREVNPAERWTVLNLALIALKRGAPDEAVQLYAETLRASRNAGRPQFVSYALEGVARVAALRGQDELAARLWGASEAMRERLNAPLQHVERETHDAAVAASRKRAGEQAHASAWAAGRAMPIDELVDQALELAG